MYVVKSMKIDENKYAIYTIDWDYIYHNNIS